MYVALGASDALGVGSSEPEKQGYVPLLAQHLPQGSRTLDLGVDGILLHAALQEELPDALAAKPGLVTAWFGANDFIRGVSYDSYIQDLGTLLRRLSTETHARIAIANLPDLTLLPALDRLSAAQKTWARQQIQRWNAGTAAQARLNGAILVDLYSHNSQLTAHPEYVSADGFHPSAQGYSQLARYFWQAINKS